MINQQYNPHFIAEPVDTGAMNTFMNSARLNFNQSFGSAVTRNASAWLADRMAVRRGEDPITEEDFNQKYSLDGALKWEEGMSEARAMLLAEWKNQEMWLETKLSGDSARNHWVANLAGGFAGSMVHPIDIATMVFTPEIGIASGIGKVAKGAKAGAAAWSSTKTFGKYVFSGMAAGAFDGAWQSPALLALNGRIQANYSQADAAMDFLMSPIFGGALGGIGYSGRKLVAGVDFAETITGQDGGKTALAAVTRPEFVAKASKIERVKELTRRIDILSRDASKNLADKLRKEAEGEAWEAELNRILGDMEWESSQMPQVARTLKKAADALDDASLRDVHARSSEPTSEVGKTLSRLMLDLFGVEVRTVKMDSDGLTFARRGGTVYIDERNKGQMFVQVVGHEFSHSLRMREPELFQQILQTINSTPEFKSIFNQGTKDIARRYGKRWDTFSSNKKMDEAVAQTFSYAFKDQRFWDKLAEKPTLRKRLVDLLDTLINKIKTYLGKSNDPGMQGLIDELTDILKKANPHKTETDARWFQKGSGFSSQVYTPAKAGKPQIYKVASELNRRGYDQKKEMRDYDLLDEKEQGADHWFGVPLESWIKEGVLKRTHTITQSRKLLNVNSYISKSKGIPVFYKDGKKLDIPSVDAKDQSLEVDKIEFYNYTGDKPGIVSEKTGDTRGKDGADPTDRVQGVSEIVVDLDPKIEGDYGDLSKMSTEEILSIYTPSDQKAKWLREQHYEQAKQSSKNKKALDRAQRKMRAELRAIVGDTVPFQVNGEQYFKALDDLDESEFYAAYASVVDQMRGTIGVSPIKVYPPDAMLKEITLSGDLIDRAFVAEESSHSSAFNTLREILGGPDKERSARRIEIVRSLIDAERAINGEIYGNPLAERNFYGLIPEEHAEALIALDERLSNPDDFWEIMELPKWDDFTDKAYGKFLSHAKSFASKFDIRRNQAIVDATLQGEKNMAERAARVFDKAARLEEMQNYEIDPEFMGMVNYILDPPKKNADGERPDAPDVGASAVPIAHSYVKNVELMNKARDVATSNKWGMEKDLDNPKILDFDSDFRLGTLKDKIRVAMRNAEGTSDRIAKILEVIDEEQTRINFNLLNDFKIRSTLWARITSMGGNALKNIDTMLDGLFRSTDGKPDLAAVQSSVESKMHGRVTEDTEALTNVIDAEAMYDAYSSDLITPDIVKYLESDRTAEVPKAVKRIGDVIYNIYRKQVSEMNAAGADVKWLIGFALTQRWDLAKVKARTYEQFKAIVEPWLDMARINKYHKNVQTDIDAYLRAVYQDMVEGRVRDMSGVDTELFGGNIANQVSHNRSLFLKEGGTFPVMSAFGRGDSVGQMILNQITKNAERTVLMENFGANYKKTFAELLINTGAKTTPQRPGKGKPGKVAETLHKAKVWLTERTFEQLTGDLDIPINQRTAAIGQNVRRYSNLVFLWQSSITALNDVGGIVARLKYEGSTVRFRSLGEAHQSFWGAVQTAYKNRDNKAAQIWLRSNGAALTSFRNNMMARIGLGETTTGKLGKWNNFLFNLNGLNFITDLGQSIYMDLSTMNLGSGEISGDMLRALSRHDISFQELSTARERYARTVEGYEGKRLSPDMFDIADPDLARKFRNFLEDGMRQAVIEPGIREQAIARGGLQAGSPEGETFRAASQYITFPLAIQMKTIGRLMNGYGEREFAGMMSSGQSRGLIHALSYAATGIVMAYMSTAIKDILKGREPIHLGNMNSKNFARIMDASGVLGIIGPLFHGPVSPLAREFIDLRAELNDNEISLYNLMTTAQGLLPGATIPLVGPGQDSARALLALMIGDGLGMQYETNFQSRLRYIEANMGQTSIFLKDNQ